MNQNERIATGNSWLGVIAVLFALLLLVNQGNELLKQIVIAPGSAAELGLAANCRADELEEEGLSLQECQLLVSSVQIILASSPTWFRPLQIGLSTLVSAAALLSLVVGFGLVKNAARITHVTVAAFALLVFLDVAGFIAAMGTGPLLRAQYLWPLLLWFFIHLCLFAAVLNMMMQEKKID
jgi:hypothetical protein